MRRARGGTNSAVSTRAGNGSAKSHGAHVRAPSANCRPSTCCGTVTVHAIH